MAADDPGAVDAQSSGGSSEATAAALPVVTALAVGALFVLFTLYARHSSSTASSSSTSSARGNASAASAETRRHESRIRAYVENQVAAHSVVLFVDTASSNRSLAHFQALFSAIFSPTTAAVAVVDLETTAQGKRVLEALREPADGSNTHGLQQQQQTEFLFVKGVLMGDYARVRQLLIDEALAAELADKGVECAFDDIRVDRHSDAGFIVLGPQHCFQTVDSAAAAASKLPILLETRPLDTVEELLSADSSTLLLPRVPLAERARNPARRSKLLVCHDMKGGYLSDRFTQGSADFDAYRFYQWELVDLFVYFGHHLVCIPPVGWIAAGHRNGTRVLGALVTEGGHGTTLCAQIFKDRESAQACASKLAVIAAHYSFDGYLVNIESSVDEEMLPNVFAFLETLSKRLKAANPDAQVIWYASLARDGRKKHQVRLDVDGAPFFRFVDGFFTDYGWTSDDAKYSAAFDLDRRFDVFMGVDVFGRHEMLGGGKMNCDVALRTAWNAGVSAALFAPGWTHECLQHERTSEEEGDDGEKGFAAVEERFWSRIRASWKPRSPCFSVFGGRDSLYSAFNAGRGKRVFVDGAVAIDPRDKTTEWSNLLEMDQQPVPSLHSGVTVQTRDSTLHAVLAHETAFQGGTCVSVQGEMSGKDKAYVKLFDADIELSARRITEISYTSAQQIDGSVTLLVLTVCPGLDRAAHQVILRSSESSGDGSSSSDSEPSVTSAVAGISPGKHFYSPVWTREYTTKSSTSDGEGDGTQQPHVWVKKTYRLGGMAWDQKHIVEIGILCTKKIDKTSSSSNNKEAGRKYHACIGEVCVVGHANVRSKASVGTIAAPPTPCVSAHVSSFRRVDSSNVAFQVGWELSASGGDGAGAGGEAVQYVLVYLVDRVDSSGVPGKSKRTLLGKSFGTCFDVERCPWQQFHEDTSSSSSSPSLLHIELVSVSWTGTSASSAGVCNVYIDEMS